jgi:hypothetical protein
MWERRVFCSEICVPINYVGVATGWTTGRSRFDPRQRLKDSSQGPTQQPGTMGTGALSPGLKHGRGVTLTTHPI